MARKDAYVVRPYKVGQKGRKSLAIVFPAKLAKVNLVDNNSLFILVSENKDKFVLNRITQIDSLVGEMIPEADLIDSNEQEFTTKETLFKN